MKVRAIKTQIGDYGKKFPGDEFVVTASYGKELIAKGRVEDITEDGDDEKVEIEDTKEKKEVKHTSKKIIK